MTTGIGTAIRRPGLVVLLWAWHAALALIIALPYFAWLAGLTAVRPAADVLLEGLQLGTLADLLQASDGPSPWLPSILAAVVGLTLLSNAFLSGGLFDAVIRQGSERLLPRFFRAAGYYFFRSLGLLAITAVLLVAAAAAAALLAGLLGSVVGGAGGEAGGAAQALFVLLLLAVAAAFLLLALDYSRVRLVSEDRSSVLRTWLEGARFVVSNPLRAVAPGVVYGIAILAVLAVAAWASVDAETSTWPLILGLFALQQGLLWIRVMLRVGLVAAEARVARRYVRLPEVMMQPPADETTVGPPSGL